MRGSEDSPLTTEQPDGDGSAEVLEWGGAGGAGLLSGARRGRLWGEAVRGLWTWLWGFLVFPGGWLRLVSPSALPALCPAVPATSL